MNAEQEKKLDRLVGSVGELVAALKKPGLVAPPAAPSVRNSQTSDAPAAAGPMNVDVVVDAVIARLRDLASEDPGAIAPVVEVLLQRPEIRVKVERHTITVDGESLRGRVAQLILEGWFDKAQSPGTVQEELKSRGFNAPAPNVGKELAELARMGFFTRNNKWFTLVQSMKRSVVEA